MTISEFHSNISSVVTALTESGATLIKTFIMGNNEEVNLVRESTASGAASLFPVLRLAPPEFPVDWRREDIPGVTGPTAIPATTHYQLKPEFTIDCLFVLYGKWNRDNSVTTLVAAQDALVEIFSKFLTALNATNFVQVVSDEVKVNLFGPGEVVENTISVSFEFKSKVIC